MKILVKNIFAYYKEKNKEIEELLTIRHPQYKYMPAFKEGVWDGYIRFVNKDRNGFYYFPSGFVFAFDEFFKKFEIVDKREKPNVVLVDYNLNGIELRDYQEKSIKEALKEGRGILNLATNAGKTEVAIALTKALSNLKVLYLLHRQHLLFQTKKRFEQRLGIKCGYIGVGRFENLNERVIIAMIQTLYSRYTDKKLIDYLRSFDVVFWDEVHHLQAPSWFNVSKLFSAYYRFGLTATVPKKLSLGFYKLVALTGKVLYRVKQSELVEQGISALPMIYLVEVKSGLEGFKMEYNDAYKLFIEENEERNSLIKKICDKFKERRKVIVVKTIRHGEILKRMIDESIFLTGRESIWERLRVLEKFRKGEVKCIIATNWFEEGTDIPEIEVFVNATGGLSDRQLIQKMGRALRRKEGENRVLIFDFWDTANRYLLKHSRHRLRVYKSEGFEVKKVKGG